MAARSSSAKRPAVLPMRAQLRSRSCFKAFGWLWQKRKRTNMADTQDLQDGKNFYCDVPHVWTAFPLKGSNALNWGMKNRLARVFSPDDCRTVMLAVDHGYFQGPTTGLERIDITIAPLIGYADALMITRGALRSSIPPEMAKAVVLRSSGGQS